MKRVILIKRDASAPGFLTAAVIPASKPRVHKISEPGNPTDGAAPGIKFAATSRHNPNLLPAKAAAAAAGDTPFFSAVLLPRG